MGETQLAAAAWTPDVVEALFRLAPLGLALIDAEMRYVRVNDHLAAMHARDAASHAGRRPSEMRPGATGEEIERVVGEVMASHAPQFGVRIHGPAAEGASDDTRQFVGSYLPIHDGHAHVGVLAIIQDETERWQAERERGRLLRMAHAAAARTQTLQAVTESLNEALSPDQVGRRIVAEVRRATGAVAGLVADLHDEGLRILHDVGYGAARRSNVLGIHLDTPLGEAVRERRLVLVRSAEERARYTDALDFELEAGAYVPLLYEGEAVGVMALGFSAPGDFDAEERAFLIAVGRQCAHCLL
jgi:hypothetical protein